MERIDPKDFKRYLGQESLDVVHKMVIDTASKYGTDVGNMGKGVTKYDNVGGGNIVVVFYTYEIVGIKKLDIVLDIYYGPEIDDHILDMISAMKKDVENNGAKWYWGSDI